jgi:hypothetical protein
MRVLLYCPLRPGPDRIHPRTEASIQALEWDGPLTVVYGRDDHPTGGKYANVTAQYRTARALTLCCGYDGLFAVEADMDVPADALTKLAALETDVAYGLYVSRTPPHRWLAFYDVTYERARSYSEMPEVCRSVWGMPRGTMGLGMGCTFVHRHVLERIQFRLVPGHPACCDWHFSLDCRRAGFRQMTHFGVVCGHITAGPVLWPDPEAPNLVQLEYPDGENQPMTNPMFDAALVQKALPRRELMNIVAEAHRGQ